MRGAAPADRRGGFEPGARLAEIAGRDVARRALVGDDPGAASVGLDGLARQPVDRGLTFHARPPMPAASGRQADDGHRALALVERDLVDQALPDRERLHSGALDSRDMDEDRRAAVFGFDEAIPLLGAERCHGADHGSLQWKIPKTTRATATVPTNSAIITPVATAWNRSDVIASPGSARASAPRSSYAAAAPSRAPGVAPQRFRSSSIARSRCRIRSGRADGERR